VHIIISTAQRINTQIVFMCKNYKLIFHHFWRMMTKIFI